VCSDADEVEALSEQEYRTRAEPLFSAVFTSGDAFDEPVRTSIPRRGLLYPSATVLPEEQLRAAATAAQAVGDRSLFLSVLRRPAERPMLDTSGAWHWEIPLDRVGAYYHLYNAHGIENAFYSPNGLWGILTTWEQFSLVAGSARFVDELYGHLSVPESMQVRRFVEDWKGNHEQWGANVAWVPRVLTHLYGPDVTRAWLQSAGWPSDPAAWQGRYPHYDDSS
jgi:hypothetical protein